MLRVGGWTGRGGDTSNDEVSHLWGPGQYLREGVKMWRGQAEGKQLGQPVSLSSHSCPPITQQKVPPLAPSTDPQTQGCPILGETIVSWREDSLGAMQLGDCERRRCTGCLGSNPSSTTYPMCNFEQVTSPNFSISTMRIIMLPTSQGSSEALTTVPDTQWSAMGTRYYWGP